MYQPNAGTEQPQCYNARLLYIRSNLDFVPWPYQVPRHHPPHWPEKKPAPRDVVTRDV